MQGHNIRCPGCYDHDSVERRRLPAGSRVLACFLNPLAHYPPNTYVNSRSFTATGRRPPPEDMTWCHPVNLSTRIRKGHRLEKFALKWL